MRRRPLLHDILTIQTKYGADPTTRVGDTVYGFNSNAGNAVYDFGQNPYPHLAIYDAGGIDTIDLSGFNISQFIDLHAGAFSSIGAGLPDRRRRPGLSGQSDPDLRRGLGDI